MCREFCASAQTVAVSRENDILYWGWTASQQSPPRPHCELRTSSSADFIFVGELSREVIGKGSHFERGPTAARVNSVQLDPIKLIFGKDPDELPGLEFGRHIHREASAIPSPALAQATTPSAEATFIRPSTVTDVARSERVKLQPVGPERPGPRMQSWPVSSAGVCGIPQRAR
jgi:hypothetical protein